MNGIVMLKKSSVKTGFFISSENYLTGEKLKIYKIPKISRNVMKRLIKKLKRDNIKALAVDDNFKEEQILLLKENFEIADINKALLKNISRIIKKYAKSRGYTDGKIKVGILCDISLNILTDAKREIGCI